MWNGAAWQNWQKTVMLFQAIPKPCPIITPVTYVESAFVEVFMLNNLNFFRMNTYEKPGEGCKLLLTRNADE
jgi:hypothetical protein